MSNHPDYALRGLNVERLKAIELHAGEQILDVGCGNGNYVLHLADQRQIRGCDYKRFDTWSRRPDLFDVCDAQSLPMADDSVDTILSFETLEHLPDPKRALSEYLRVARKNVIVTVPSCELTPGMKQSGIIYNHWIDRTHVNFWALDSLSEDVAAAGFRVDRRSHINHINLGFVLMEALGFRGFLARAGAAVFRRLQRRTYPMTCLVVASKPPAGSAPAGSQVTP